MGIVYLAREVRLDRLVALKLLPPHLASQPALRERFLREARTAAALSHPNVVPIYAVDEAGAYVFYVMAYVGGETLANRIAARGKLPPGEATRLLREVAWALAYAHAQGIVHRDVKPENILIEEGSGRALVADFGIARVAEAGGGTGVGELLGTPEYMSPEQAAAEALDGRSDLYSLGVVGFLATSGQLPFTAPTTAGLLSKHLTEAPPPLATVTSGTPPALCRAVDRCLAKTPGDRFASGEAMAEALADALESRQEVPVALRVFLKRTSQEQQALGGLGAFLALMTLPTLIAFAVESAGAVAGVAVVTAFAGLMGAGYLAALLPRLRKLLKLGYAGSDVEAAAMHELKRRKEELAFEYGPKPMQYRNWLTVGGASLAVIGIAISWPFHLAGATGVLLVLGGGLSALVGFRRAADQQDFGAMRRAKFWGGRLAKWLFRMAGIGLDSTQRAAVNRPTELAIGSAADVLFEALPRETRKSLGDVPGTLRTLERHAQEIRRRMEQLDALLADAGGGRRRDIATAERDQVVNDLRQARDAAEQRHSELVAMLETIRLHLVRLRAGVGTLSSATADLSRAREISEQSERLALAHGEIDAALSSGA